MKPNHIIIVFLILVSSNFTSASGMRVCQKYLTPDKQSFLLSEAFQASDLVAIGKVSLGEKTKLKINHKIKGNAGQEIELQQPTCQGTACTGGFSVGPAVDLLFFLKKQSNGIYNSVTNDGNFSCPVVFEVENGFAKFRDKKIAVESLHEYLLKKTSTVPLQ